MRGGSLRCWVCRGGRVGRGIVEMIGYVWWKRGGDLMGVGGFGFRVLMLVG